MVNLSEQVKAGILVGIVGVIVVTSFGSIGYNTHIRVEKKEMSEKKYLTIGVI